MRDDYLGRDWADGHRRFSTAIHKAIHLIGESFDRLNVVQYDAPWLVRGEPRSKIRH